LNFPLSLLCAAAAAALSCAASAQSTDDAQQVVVTATRQPARIDAQLSDVSVIDRAQIENAGGRTLVELLAQQPGLQFIANGGLGQTQSISIRGTDVRHTLLLIDGVRYGSTTLGQATFENIPLESIERIEIVRGPLSSLYGSEAIGGVIQIFTRDGARGVHPSASVGAGANRYRSASVGVRFGDGAWSGSVQAEHQDNRGFSATNEKVPFGSFDPDDDGFRQNALDASLGYRIDADWHLKAHALRSEGLTHYDDGPGTDTRAKLTTQAAGVDLDGRIVGTWRSTLKLARSLDVYDTVASASPFTDLGAITNAQEQLAWENRVATPLGSLLALVEHLKQSVHKPVTDYDVTERTIDALALGLDGQHGAHTWQASARHDRNSQFGSVNTGNLAYGVAITPQWRVGAALGNSFSAPSFNLLYYPFFGNPNLLPERGHNREASLRWTPADGQQLSLTAFSNRVRNYITVANTNVPRARIDGATLAYAGRIADWSLAASLDELNARDDSGVQLPRRAKHSAKLSADRSVEAFSFGATLAAFSARRDTNYDANFNPVPVALPGFATLDLRTDWRFARDWTLQARLNNVADRRYETAYGYNQPGRELYVTLRWAMN
jgi:vitamin B12 transporter